MRILLLHGFLGNSNQKLVELRRAGHEVYRPRLPNFSFKRALRKAEKASHIFKPDCIVGSSRGAAIAMNMTGNKPLILMAPAWRKFGQARTVENTAIIIHGSEDSVIPLQDSVELKERSSKADLYVVDDKHRLTGKGLNMLISAVGIVNR